MDTYWTIYLNVLPLQRHILFYKSTLWLQGWKWCIPIERGRRLDLRLGGHIQWDIWSNEEYIDSIQTVKHKYTEEETKD